MPVILWGRRDSWDRPGVSKRRLHEVYAPVSPGQCLASAIETVEQVVGTLILSLPNCASEPPLVRGLTLAEDAVGLSQAPTVNHVAEPRRPCH